MYRKPFTASPTPLTGRGRTASTMTRDTTRDTPITSQDAFQSALATLVESAISNDIDIRGAWEFQTSGSPLEWEVTISELDRSAGTDDPTE